MNRNLFNRSLQELRSARTITVCAMMGAAALVLGAYSIYLTPTIKIGFSSLPNLFVAWLFGPSVGMIFNGTMDILKYFMKPVGGFFPPLTLVTMMAGVIYGCFFYGRQLSFRRVLAAKLVVVIVCNIVLNTYCLSLLTGKGFWGILPDRIVKNLIMWPIDSLIFYYVARVLESAGLFRAFARRVKSGK